MIVEATIKKETRGRKRNNEMYTYYENTLEEFIGLEEMDACEITDYVGSLSSARYYLDKLIEDYGMKNKIKVKVFNKKLYMIKEK